MLLQALTIPEIQARAVLRASTRTAAIEALTACSLRQAKPWCSDIELLGADRSLVACAGTSEQLCRPAASMYLLSVRNAASRASYGGPTAWRCTLWWTRHQAVEKRSPSRAPDGRESRSRGTWEASREYFFAPPLIHRGLRREGGPLACRTLDCLRRCVFRSVRSESRSGQPAKGHLML